jgi:hypothetical protein
MVQRQNQKCLSLEDRALLVAVFVLVFKKGYIAIEAVDEQEGEGQEENNECNI